MKGIILTIKKDKGVIKLAKAWQLGPLDGPKENSLNPQVQEHT